MKYNKLVRDKIPACILTKGGAPVYHKADEKEYGKKLKEKLFEEAEEFKKDESLEEFADLLEVINAIADYKGFSQKAIKLIMDKKAKEKGKFKERIILQIEI